MTMISVYNETPRSTQPSIPMGREIECQCVWLPSPMLVTLCDPIWQVMTHYSEWNSYEQLYHSKTAVCKGWISSYYEIAQAT